jgi:uncharacterized protein YgfB (UPF0149 family)
VQDVSELVKDRHGNGWLHLLQVLSNLTAETDRNLNTVVGRLVQQEEQDLAGEHFVLDLLVDKMGEEGSRGEADGLVVSLEAFSKLHNQATHK